MKKLGKAQSYGIIAMLLGFSFYIMAAILLPQQKLLWILAWGVAFIGAGVYTFATFPDAITWLMKIMGRKKK